MYPVYDKPTLTEPLKKPYGSTINYVYIDLTDIFSHQKGAPGSFKDADLWLASDGTLLSNSKLPSHLIAGARWNDGSHTPIDVSKYMEELTIGMYKLVCNPAQSAGTAPPPRTAAEETNPAEAARRRQRTPPPRAARTPPPRAANPNQPL